jgi:hypothetical protein
MLFPAKNDLKTDDDFDDDDDDARSFISGN